MNALYRLRGILGDLKAVSRGPGAVVDLAGPGVALHELAHDRIGEIHEVDGEGPSRLDRIVEAEITRRPRVHGRRRVDRGLRDHRRPRRGGGLVGRRLLRRRGLSGGLVVASVGPRQREREDGHNRQRRTEGDGHPRRAPMSPTVGLGGSPCATVPVGGSPGRATWFILLSLVSQHPSVPATGSTSKVAPSGAEP